MEYPWRCPECHAETTVTRRMRDYKEPPVNPCAGCGNTEGWTRVATVPNIGSTEDHKGGFPLRVKNLKRSFSVENGRMVPTYEDVVFSSRSQQKKWLKENGMCLTDAGRSPEYGSSQHSAYDQKHTAPSARAERMLAGSKFVEDPTTKHHFD